MGIEFFSTALTKVQIKSKILAFKNTPSLICCLDKAKYFWKFRPGRGKIGAFSWVSDTIQSSFWVFSFSVSIIQISLIILTARPYSIFSLLTEKSLGANWLMNHDAYAFIDDVIPRSTNECPRNALWVISTKSLAKKTCRKSIPCPKSSV